MPGAEVQLIIKAPNQNVDDHTVDCNLEWTIRELKEHLSLYYPNNPAVNEQKLIYSGHLLHDHLRLREILRHEDSQDSVHILHLVYNSLNAQEQNRQSSQNWSSAATQPSSSNPPSLIHRNVTPVSTSNTVYPQFSPPVERPTPVPVVFTDPQVAAQIAAMQQMYAYYFTQYLQSLNPPPAPQTPPPAEVAPPEPRVGAEEHRDWLDQVYVVLRFVVFFCALYFYSSPERLMIVIACAVIALLHHEGWFMRRLNPPAEPPQRNNENDHPLNQEANDDSHDEHDLEAAMDGDLPPHAHPPAPPIFSPLAFLTAFFSSLIPEPPPPPVNIN